MEGLNLEKLSAVQQAIVDEGATQCGFCTPGIVVSLTGHLMDEETNIDDAGIKAALSGHLCRCTGYRSLKASVPRLREAIGDRSGIAALVESGDLPPYFIDMPDRLREIAPLSITNGYPDAILIAGGTDLYVQRGETLPGATVNVLNLHPEMRGIERRGDVLHVGALTTFEAFAQDAEVQQLIPHIQDYMFLIASLQIRNRATLGGNLINASPIGDMTVLLLALEADLVLTDGDSTRTVNITDFYQGYKQLDRTGEEILTEILIPVPAGDTHIHWEKVSKRKCLDIATVNSAIRIRCDAEGVIEAVGLAMGGVAPVPLFMEKTCAYLRGKAISPQTIEGAMVVAQAEIAPISDVRGSAAYKRLLVRQFLIAHFATLYPERVQMEAFI
ncbi:MAG: FAD binding domain-containing protein [Acidiferrobacterales bacterium]|nr:FAD binding domain-containing protein [Acidiferrobacterales bacterium]